MGWRGSTTYACTWHLPLPCPPAVGARGASWPSAPWLAALAAACTASAGLAVAGPSAFAGVGSGGVAASGVVSVRRVLLRLCASVGVLRMLDDSSMPTATTTKHVAAAAACPAPMVPAKVQAAAVSSKRASLGSAFFQD